VPSLHCRDAEVVGRLQLAAGCSECRVSVRPSVRPFHSSAWSSRVVSFRSLAPLRRLIIVARRPLSCCRWARVIADALLTGGVVLKKKWGGRLKKDLDKDLQLHRILILLY